MSQSFFIPSACLIYDFSNSCAVSAMQEMCLNFSNNARRPLPYRKNSRLVIPTFLTDRISRGVLCSTPAYDKEVSGACQFDQSRTCDLVVKQFDPKVRMETTKSLSCTLAYLLC